MKIDNPMYESENPNRVDPVCEFCETHGIREDPVDKYLSIVPENSNEEPSFFFEGDESYPCRAIVDAHQSCREARHNNGMILIEFNKARKERMNPTT